MSFNRLTSLEAQVPGREDDDDEYHDDPEFLRLTQSLSGPLVELTSNISFLSQQVELLGSHRDNERLRERIHTLLEDTREICRSAGEGIKKVQAWEDVTVSYAQPSRQEFFAPHFGFIILVLSDHFFVSLANSHRGNGRSRSSQGSSKLVWKGSRQSNEKHWTKNGRLP